ncbi:MAG: filamentous hemagglutinin N-terminal domain-containing protein [Xenococcus sp. (in: cyanobacteria)]
MKQRLSLLLSMGCYILSQAIFSQLATAQVSPDGTTNTAVDVNGNDFTINQGDRAGGNLFHSFSDFYVPNSGSAFFNNATDIVNIFSRVTGGNISNINGLLRAQGNANLFLLNPAGIIFGENARLDIGGSFYGGTTDSILFPDGEFSATDFDNPPLLTINAPIGLNFRDNPGDIVNQSTASVGTGFFNNPVGLQVKEGQSITLEAGNIFFDGGLANAPGGSITLKATGNIDIINEEFNIGEQSIDTRSIFNSVFNNGGEIVLNSSGGSITIIDAQLSSDSSSEIGSGGNITLTAKESISLINSLFNTVTTSSTGRGGNLIINAGSSIRLEDMRIDVSNFGDGRSGDITIEAVNDGNIEFIGTEEDLDFTNTSVAAAEIFVDAFGSGIALEDGQTGGDLTIKGGSITINNFNFTSRVNAFDDFFLLPNLNTQGSAGDISITGNSIVIQNNSSLVTETLGEGNAGNINLNATNNIVLNNEVELNTRTQSSGFAGIVNINADSLNLDSSSIKASNIPLQVVSGELFGGNIDLNLTGNLLLRDQSTISAEAENNANGGNIEIGAEFIIAFPSQGNGNDIIANANQGRGGIITINAESLFNIQERSSISLGNDINASSNIEGLDGTVSINTPEVDPLKGAIELPTNPVSEDTIDDNVCWANRNPESQNTFSIKRKGGIPPTSIEPFDSDDILVNEQNINLNLQAQTRAFLRRGDLSVRVPPIRGQALRIQNSARSFISHSSRHRRVARQYPEIEPVETSTIDIIPARGIIKTKDGQIILTAYPTDNINIRTPHISGKCNSPRNKKRRRGATQE